MKPEILTTFDPETGATDVLVNGGTYMRVNPDGTIDGFGGVIGDVLLGETFPLRTQEYMDWVTALAAQTPAIPVVQS